MFNPVLNGFFLPLIPPVTATRLGVYLWFLLLLLCFVLVEAGFPKLGRGRLNAGGVAGGVNELGGRGVGLAMLVGVLGEEGVVL